MHVGVFVCHVLDDRLPVGVAVDFVDEEVRPAVVVMVFHHLRQGVVGKPHIVERDIQCLFGAVPEGFFDVLQHERGFANASGTLDGYQPVVPVDLVVQVAVDVGFHPPYSCQ